MILVEFYEEYIYISNDEKTNNLIAIYRIQFTKVEQKMGFANAFIY